ALRDPIFLVRRISFHASERLTNTLAAHGAILDAVVARDPPRASEAMARHPDEGIGDVRRVEARLGTPLLAFDPSTLPGTGRGVGSVACHKSRTMLPLALDIYCFFAVLCRRHCGVDRGFRQVRWESVGASGLAGRRHQRRVHERSVDLGTAVG